MSNLSYSQHTLQMDIAFIDAFAHWGGSRAGWFKPRLSAQVSELEGRTLIAGNTIDEVKTQIANYETEQKQVQAQGFFARSAFTIRHWFSPIPRFKAVL